MLNTHRNAHSDLSLSSLDMRTYLMGHVAHHKLLADTRLSFFEVYSKGLGKSCLCHIVLSVATCGNQTYAL